MDGDFQQARRRSGPRLSVCFLYIAQPHQVLHSLSIALELRRRWPHVDVEIAATCEKQLRYVADLLARLEAPPLRLVLLGPGFLRRLRPRGSSVPAKAPMLAANLARLARYDAIVTPERTSSLLRGWGVRRTKLIYTQHGAGDRGGVFEPRLKLFDLVMASGPKFYERIVEAGLAAPEACAVVGYPKFDIVEALPPGPMPQFDRRRPVVIYNPHFKAALSSWPSEGEKVLAAFAEDRRYNLIFAPHVRLFDGQPRARAALEPFAAAPNIHISLSGEAMIDMTYTRCADIYLGDVSSQVYEFLRTPRPCVFIDAHRTDWRGDENYRFWEFGPVVRRAEDVLDAVDRSRQDHEDVYRSRQEAGFAETFDLQARSSSERAAEAIVRRLERVGAL